MTVSAPPRPSPQASEARGSKPLERDEIEALVEALIEEARREQRRRHQRYWALAALVAFVSVVVLVLLQGGAASQTASSAGSARFNAPAAAPTSQIAFTRDTKAGEVHREIHVMNADGSGQRLLAREAGLGLMAWSPDGRKIAFVRSGLMVVRADGSGELRLTRDAVGGSGFLAWGDLPGRPTGRGSPSRRCAAATWTST